MIRSAGSNVACRMLRFGRSFAHLLFNAKVAEVRGSPEGPRSSPKIGVFLRVTVEAGNDYFGTRVTAFELTLQTDEITRCILMLRGRRVLLDADLARIYGVTTKRLNEQVKRNARRFPRDFAFRLTRHDTQALARLRSQNATLKRGQHIKHLSFAFTEHGAIQAANVLNSEAAIEMGLFVRMRKWPGTQRALAAKLAELERRICDHDVQIMAIIEALRQLATTETTRHRRKIGFHQGNR